MRQSEHRQPPERPQQQQQTTPAVALAGMSEATAVALITGRTLTLTAVFFVGKPPFLVTFVHFSSALFV